MSKQKPVSGRAVVSEGGEGLRVDGTLEDRKPLSFAEVLLNHKPRVLPS